MRRFGMIARLHSERRDEYLELHRNVWPGVAQTITECGIRNFTIFERGGVIVGYFEYIGDDYEADQERMSADPVTQEWWSRTGPCQAPFDALDDASGWQELPEAWHQD